VRNGSFEAERKVAERKADNPDAFNLRPSKRSIQELTEFFTRVEQGANRILPKEKQRFVIYLRKSTDDEAKQVRSLDDQRTECLELAENGLKIHVREEDILEESASAKVSGNRPIFDKMIEGFETGKYHGLISWSPDRRADATERRWFNQAVVESIHVDVDGEVKRVALAQPFGTLLDSGLVEAVISETTNRRPSRVGGSTIVKLVEYGGVEPPTSAMRMLRSSQLS